MKGGCEDPHLHHLRSDQTLGLHLRHAATFRGDSVPVGRRTFPRFTCQTHADLSRRSASFGDLRVLSINGGDGQHLVLIEPTQEALDF